MVFNGKKTIQKLVDYTGLAGFTFGERQNIMNLKKGRSTSWQTAESVEGRGSFGWVGISITQVRYST